jgi:CHASE3 domain sensor protein
MSHNEILILIITQIVLPLFVYITLIFLVIIGIVYAIIKWLNKGTKESHDSACETLRI